jgi:hypothetical protein
MQALLMLWPSLPGVKRNCYNFIILKG